jgi:hypothetical protein
LSKAHLLILLVVVLVVVVGLFRVMVLANLSGFTP